MTSLNSRAKSASWSGSGMPFALVWPRLASPNSVSIVREALAGCDLHAHPGGVIARIPPVMPHPRFNDSRLALAQDAPVPVALDGQLTFQRGEALDERRVAVLAGHARPDERGELGP